MKVSENGINLIKQFEGCKLTAYKDLVGVWTIGYGTTSADKAITDVEIREGLKITQKKADNWLKKSVNQKYSGKVMKYDSIYHWNQNQFDALCCFAYNIGSIDQLVQNGKRSIKEISEKILVYNKAGGKELPGLTRRRIAEKALFDKAISSRSNKTERESFDTVALSSANEGEYVLEATALAQDELDESKEAK